MLDQELPLCREVEDVGQIFLAIEALRYGYGRGTFTVPALLIQIPEAIYDSTRQEALLPANMSSPDILELATRIPLPRSTSTIYLSPTSLSNDLPDERRVSGVVNESMEHDSVPRLNESSLPPMDGGFHAWSYVRVSSLLPDLRGLTLVFC